MRVSHLSVDCQREEYEGSGPRHRWLRFWGAAGIQADIKTVTVLGGYAATAIIALTAQNTLGVYGVIGIDPACVASQIEVVLDDIGTD